MLAGQHFLEGPWGSGTKPDARGSFTQAGRKSFGADSRGDPSSGTTPSPGTAFPRQRDATGTHIGRGATSDAGFMLLVVNDINATTGFGLEERRMRSKVFENEFLAIKFDGNEHLPKPAVSVFTKKL